jgi:hypothetical protein
MSQKELTEQIPQVCVTPVALISEFVMPAEKHLISKNFKIGKNGFNILKLFHKMDHYQDPKYAYILFFLKRRLALSFQI